MSLYNLINGYNPAGIFFLPMLGKHPDEYPRFRDCFLYDEDKPEHRGHIHIYTRTGGMNRNYYSEENSELTNMPGYVTDYDDSFDSTFATWVFEVPDEWREQYEAITRNRAEDITQEYYEHVMGIYPKLKDDVPLPMFKQFASMMRM